MPQVAFNPHPPAAAPHFKMKPSREKSRSTLCDTISRIFCCCCFRSKPPVQETPRASKLDESPLSVEGRQLREHVLFPSSSRRTTIMQGDPQLLVYNKLNAMDYAEVRDLIASDTCTLPDEQCSQLLALLDTMEKRMPFLDPDLISKNIKNFPSTFLEKIRACACVALIHKAGTRLLPLSSRPPMHNPMKMIFDGLDVSFRTQSESTFYTRTGYPPKTIQEKAESIRWGVLYQYDPQKTPESIKSLSEDVYEMTDDEKETRSSIPERHDPSSTHTELSPQTPTLESSFRESLHPTPLHTVSSVSSFYEEISPQRSGTIPKDTSMETLSEERFPISRSVPTRSTSDEEHQLDVQFSLNATALQALHEP